MKREKHDSEQQRMNSNDTKRTSQTENRKSQRVEHREMNGNEFSIENDSILAFSFHFMLNGIAVMWFLLCYRFDSFLYRKCCSHSPNTPEHVLHNVRRFAQEETKKNKKKPMEINMLEN